ncbi:hypothetical protein [Actinoplanes sp. NPDC051411]|uniref:hypothetical protein n=1 Tax=Actinoplanes sp. NPDC051411 TaxID=3155522 RepID=UPI003424A1B7
MNNNQYSAFAYNWTIRVPDPLKPYYEAQFQDSMIRTQPCLQRCRGAIDLGIPAVPCRRKYAIRELVMFYGNCS